MPVLSALPRSRSVFSFPSLLAAALGVAALSGPAWSGSYNIDFGNGTTPDASYGAAGSPGTWNTVGVLPNGTRQNLLNTDGVSDGARIYMILSSPSILETDDPGTSGDDEALVDDMLIGLNNPIDVCVWVEGIPNGEYEVITYALTPADPGLLSPVRVDFANEGPIMIGGSWPGSHQEVVTYARHTVNITSGNIGLHSGEPSLNAQTGINGFQIRPVVPADVGEFHLETPGLQVFPNPARGSQQLVWARPSVAESGLADGSGSGQEVESQSGGAVLRIFDAGGRLHLTSEVMFDNSGRAVFEWNGLDDLGRPVAPSVYFARVEGYAPVRIIRVR